MSPPPPPGTRSYLLDIQAEYEARRAESEEIRRLKREIEKRRLEQELADLSSPTNSSQPKRRPIEYYENQLNAWFNSLPAAARQAPRSMHELLSILKGRSPGLQPHAGEVSDLLALNGWKRKRQWRADGEGRRFWYPPRTPSTLMS
jgi:hypothetical protein